MRLLSKLRRRTNRPALVLVLLTMPRVHVPGPIRKLFEARGGLTVIVLVITSAVTEPFDLGWRRLEILAFAALLAIIGEFWRDSAQHEPVLSGLRQERQEADARAAEASSTAQRIPELEAENFALEQERDQLRERLNSPRFSLEDILGSLDGQLHVLGLVEKHRQMMAEGHYQWPVTSLQLTDEGVRITAHADEPAEIAVGESVTMVDTAGDVLLAYTTVQFAYGHQLMAGTELELLPEFLQEQLVDQHQVTPYGVVLRLTGLTLSPYSVLTPEQVTELEHSLREAARAIGRTLNPTQQLELEEAGE